MAVIYLRSADGSDASDGLTWANAKATLAAALTAAGAGGTVYVADGHAETQASSMTLTSPGTMASPVKVICVDDTGDPEPPTAVATTATVSTTSNTGILITGVSYYYGITFQSGDGGTIGSHFQIHDQQVFEECELYKRNTEGNRRLVFGHNTGSTDEDDHVILLNTDIRSPATSFWIETDGHVVWRGGSLLGTAPTGRIFRPVTDSGTRGGPRLEVYGVDLSIVTSGNIADDGTASGAFDAKLVDCKLGSGVAISSSTIDNPRDLRVLVVNCDSADTNYRFHKLCYEGEITHETTIVRTGGASDGTTSFSRKMVSDADTQFFRPLTFGDFEDPLCVWNETVGSAVTVTVEVVTDNVTLTDAEAWIEAEYLGTTGFPIASFASDRAANILATPANQTSSSETWTTTGLTTPVKQSLSVSFTPQEKGWIQVRVCLAKASTTMYFCPKVTVA